MTSYRIGSLFSGIGGLDLGLERAGVGRTVWQCEIDPFARSVLARHWPDAQRFDDVRALGRTVDVPPIDVLCGGFPCQDISNAGNQAGLTGERSGLFFEIVRLAGLLRPRFVVLENVAAIVNGGWDDDEGDRDLDGGGAGRLRRWTCSEWVARRRSRGPGLARVRCVVGLSPRSRRRRPSPEGPVVPRRVAGRPGRRRRRTTGRAAARRSCARTGSCAAIGWTTRRRRTSRGRRPSPPGRPSPRCVAG